MAQKYRIRLTNHAIYIEASMRLRRLWRRNISMGSAMSDTTMASMRLRRLWRRNERADRQGDGGQRSFNEAAPVMAQK